MNVTLEHVKAVFNEEILTIPDPMMQRFYEIAVEYAEAGFYREAADCFLFLVLLKPTSSNLWLRLGNAEQMLEKYEEAIEAYSSAMLCDADDPFPHLYLAEVYGHLNRLLEAQECLNTCFRIVDQEQSLWGLKEVLSFVQEEIRKKQNDYRR